MTADENYLHALRHSTSHLLASAIMKMYPGAKLGNGPAIENGFYYDIDTDHSFTPEDLPKIEKEMRKIAAQNVEFEVKNVSKAEAQKILEGFGQTYKLQTLSGLDDGQITFYSHGRFSDLCEGPHIKNSSELKAFKLTKIAGAYWMGNEKNKMLQRIYGVAFATEKELEDYLFQLEEAKKRDHRKLGQELDLFFISPKVGQGLPVWLPKGTTLRRTLENFLRTEQIKRGYQEVITPHIGNIELYKTSGHYPYYKESQFPPMKLEDNSNEEYLLKPMNCPHHHQIYANEPRSYRDLPLRLAEFGTVYRYEQSGELNGLTRVRGFTQDDSHIYCTPEQLKDEIKNVINLTQMVFKKFDMSVSTRLSFRDEQGDKFGGEIALWNKAEKEIQEVADELKLDYVIGKGEAAFYGPKIDFMVKDALGRRWQLGTVQVDYVMPERFQLEFIGSDNGKHRPVIIHRAPFGSMERFVAILIEHYAGAFPFWLAPVQIKFLPISDKFNDYVLKQVSEFQDMGFRVDADLRNEKIGKKIRDTQGQKVPYMIVLGEKEIEAGTYAVRDRVKGDLGSLSKEDLLKQLNQENR